VERFFKGETVWRRVARTEVRHSAQLQLFREILGDKKDELVKLFEELDIDKNKHLDKNEFEKLLERDSRLKDFDFVFRALDYDGDEKLTMEEFAFGFDAALHGDDPEEEECVCHKG